jgi:hypothetical protein
MTHMRTVDDAFGATLDEVLVAALRSAARPARSAICPICDGTMRRPSEDGGPLLCGECGSSIDDAASAHDQLRLVA